jgi:hypothetical protein
MDLIGIILLLPRKRRFMPLDEMSLGVGGGRRRCDPPSLADLARSAAGRGRGAP